MEEGASAKEVLAMPTGQIRFSRFMIERSGNRQIDNQVGFLCPGISEWQETGNLISHIGTLSALELKTWLQDTSLLVIDVREPSEWKEGYIQDTERIFFGHLQDKAASLPRNKPVAVICSVGQRASTATSILEKEGFKEVYNVLGGMTAWTSLGYPTVK